MSVWTTLEMAKKQIGVPQDDTANDDLLRRFLAIAEADVLHMVTNAGEYPVTEPDDGITGKIYVLFAELWRYRGDDNDGVPPQSRIPGSFSVQVERGLLNRRVPTIA